MSLNSTVLNNLLEFLKRVDVKGLESFAFVEAHVALQNELVSLQQSPAPGIPFVPPQPPVPQPQLPAQQLTGKVE